MDLETRTINEVVTSYCVSIYDGQKSKSFYLSDFSKGGTNAEQEMLRASILYLMKRKYHNHKVYLHNFSPFIKKGFAHKLQNRLFICRVKLKLIKIFFNYRVECFLLLYKNLTLN